MAATPGLRDEGGELLDSWRFEKRRNCEALSRNLFYACDLPLKITTDLEEIVMQADLFDTKDACPHRRK